jgi:divalent metal cation (Fe/Co/Zn/Cd) transporter
MQILVLKLYTCIFSVLVVVVASLLEVVQLDLCISAVVLVVVVASLLRVVQLDLFISAVVSEYLGASIFRITQDKLVLLR